MFIPFTKDLNFSMVILFMSCSTSSSCWRLEWTPAGHPSWTDCITETDNPGNLSLSLLEPNVKALVHDGQSLSSLSPGTQQLRTAQGSWNNVFLCTSDLDFLALTLTLTLELQLLQPYSLGSGGIRQVVGRPREVSCARKCERMHSHPGVDHHAVLDRIKVSSSRCSCWWTDPTPLSTDIMLNYPNIFLSCSRGESTFLCTDSIIVQPNNLKYSAMLAP